MTEMIVAAASVGILDETQQLIGETQPCEYAWTMGQGSWQVALRTAHKFPLDRAGAVAVAIYDPAGRLIWAMPIAAYPLHEGQLLLESAP